MIRLDLTQPERDHLARLMQDGIAELSEVQKRQLKMIMRLAIGADGTALAAEFSLKPSAVSNLAAKVRTHGLGTYLAKWDAKIRKTRDWKRKLRGVSGPKGISTLGEWTEAQRVDGEPVVELVSLAVIPGANLATFAVRHRCQKNITGALPNPIAGIVRKSLALPAKDPVFWTKLSLFDERASELLSRLREIERYFRGLTVPRERLLSLQSSLKDFENDFEFITLMQGSLAHALFDRVFQGIASVSEMNESNAVYRVREASEFFARLESTIYSLRMQRSCQGLVPSLTFVHAEVMQGVHSHEGYYWEANRKAVTETSLQHSVLMRRYLAHAGALFEMSAPMWDRVPWREDFNIETLQLRPKVRVHRRHSHPPLLVISGMPELDEILKCPPGVDAEEFATEVRGLLRNQEIRLSFHYSNKLIGMSNWVEAGTSRSQAGPDTGSIQSDLGIRKGEVFVMLAPRHMVMGQPQLPLRMLARLSKLRLPDVSVRIITRGAGLEKCLVFNAPAILEGIREAFQNGAYAQRIERLYLRQSHYVTHLLNRFGHGLSEGADSKALEELAHIGVGFLRLSDKRPSYLNIPLLRNAPGFAEPPTSYADLLRDLDADFLLSELPEQRRQAVDEMTEAWIKLNSQVIEKAYGLDLDGAGSRIRAKVGGRHTQDVEDQDLVSWTHDALNEFRTGFGRVTRSAIETAQRLSLLGLEPKAIVVEFEEGLLRKWRAYLRSWIRGRDFREKKRREFVKDADLHAIVGEHGDQAEIIAAEELMEVIEGLIEEPAQTEWVNEFVAHSGPENSTVWASLLQTVDGIPQGKQIKQAVLDALAWCQKPDEDHIQGVGRIFTGLAASIAGAAKPRQRPKKAG